MRMHSTRAKPISISRAVRKGNASLLRSAEVMACSNSRERGPCTLSCANAEVWSATKAWASPKLRFMWVSIWRCTVSEPTTKYRSSSSLVTVRSASSVPPALSHWVYVIMPGAPSTLLPEMKLSKRPASRPCTANFDMKDMSIKITPSRHARCSASQCCHQLARPNVSGPGSGVVLLPAASTAYQSAPSQPLTSLQYAPAATSRSWTGETLAPRAVCIERFGK